MNVQFMNTFCFKQITYILGNFSKMAIVHSDIV